jgi:hypothetical protein
MAYTGEDRRGINREDLSQLKEVIFARLESHEKLDDQRFHSMEKVSIERHEAVKLRIENIGRNVHDLRDDLTPIFALPERVEGIMADLEKVPRKEDLENMTETFTTKLTILADAIKDKESKSERRTANLLKMLGIVVPIVMALLMLILNVVLKKLGIG